jgi:hypothetical protein
MVILKNSNSVQRFSFIPTRMDYANYLVITNETTDETITKSINVRYQSYYSYFEMVFDFLEEGHFYNVKLQYYGVINGKLDYHLAHRDRIFCTNQTIADYSVNKNEYIESPQNIIFYE